MLLMQDRVLGETVSEEELASLLVLVITPFNLWLQTFCIWLSAIAIDDNWHFYGPPTQKVSMDKPILFQYSQRAKWFTDF